MNAFEGIVAELQVLTIASVEKEIKPCIDLWQKFENYTNKINEAIEIYKRTGIAPECNFENWEAPVVVEKKQSERDTPRRGSSKENIRPDENKGRPQRSTVKKVKPEMPPPRSKRTRQKKTENQIKEEKRTSGLDDSVILQDRTVTVINLDSDEDVVNKTEMPPPRASKRTKQKKTDKLKIKQEIIEEEPQKPSKNQDSEGIAITRPSTRSTRQKKTELLVKKETIEEDTATKVNREATMSVVNLMDSEIYEVNVKETPAPRRIKKEKSEVDTLKKITQDVTVSIVKLVDSVDQEVSNVDKKKVEKRMRSPSASEPKNGKKSKSDGLQNEANNATFITKSPVNKNLEEVPVDINTTVILEKPTYINNNKLVGPVVDNQVEKNKKALNKTTINSLKEANIKNKSEVKTKSKVQVNKEQDVGFKVSDIFTPTTSKLLQKSANCTAKKPATPTSSSKVISGKFASELKSSQAEYRQREMQRRQKEKQALASMEAQIEKRRQKQLQQLQQQEALKKEKLKQKQQQDALKQKQQQDALKQKQQQDALKQKQQQDALKQKQQQDVLKQKQKEEAEKKTKAMEVPKQPAPLYMRQRAPLLPTEDCYDSDDEESEKRTVQFPKWCTSAALREAQDCILAMGEAVKNTFFSRQVQTPDLQDIFEVIKPEKLKRSSSAIWNKAPRFTMMPVVEENLDDFEDDD